MRQDTVPWLNQQTINCLLPSRRESAGLFLLFFWPRSACKYVAAGAKTASLFLNSCFITGEKLGALESNTIRPEATLHSAVEWNVSLHQLTYQPQLKEHFLPEKVSRPCLQYSSFVFPEKVISGATCIVLLRVVCEMTLVRQAGFHVNQSPSWWLFTIILLQRLKASQWPRSSQFRVLHKHRM